MASPINEALKNLSAFKASFGGFLALEDELKKVGGWDKLAKDYEARAGQAKAALNSTMADWDKAQDALKDKQAELAATADQAWELAKSARSDAAAIILKAKDEAAAIARDAQTIKGNALALADNAASLSAAKVAEAESELAELVRQINVADAALAASNAAKAAVDKEVARLKSLFGGA
jgi:chromosome segregation ATPase